METLLQQIEEKGNFDNRIERGGNWRGHMGMARAESSEIFLARSWASPFWGTNLEEISFYEVGSGGVEVYLTPETNRTPWVRGQIFKDIDIEEVAFWLAQLPERSIESGPTYLYYELFLPEFN